MKSRRVDGLWVCVGLLFLATGCDGILDVDDSGIIVAVDLDEAGPSAVPTLVNGMVGDYHVAMGGIVRYTSLLTDEMILSGTFPTRVQVDDRRIQANNGSLTSELYAPLHTARMMADTVAHLLDERLDDPGFESVIGDLGEGVALGRLYGGYARIWLAELYCWSILTGMFPESAPLLPDDRMRQALTLLEEAEAVAVQFGLEAIRWAAVVGQARGHLWLREYDQAASLAAQVPRDFGYWIEHSGNDPSQYNEVYMFTWGDTEAIRWTVGDGTTTQRGNERWEHFEAFVALNLIRDRPDGFTSFDDAIPVGLQTLYSRPGADVRLASGVEAALIRAESAVRAGQTGVAEDLLNDLRADYSFRVAARWDIEPPAPENALDPLSLSGDLAVDLNTVADERARELWLTGDRHTTSRRLRLDPTVQIDLFPPKEAIDGGDDIAFPIVQTEVENNPNLHSGDVCPAGQQPGGWR